MLVNEIRGLSLKTNINELYFKKTVIIQWNIRKKDLQLLATKLTEKYLILVMTKIGGIFLLFDVTMSEYSHMLKNMYERSVCSVWCILRLLKVYEEPHIHLTLKLWFTCNILLYWDILSRFSGSNACTMYITGN